MLTDIKDFFSTTKLGRYLAVAFLVLIVFTALNTVWDTLARLGWASPVSKETKTISISADGKVTVSPDTAKISFSVVTDGQTAEEVQQKNTQVMNKVIDYVKSNGVDAQDIKTTNYNLYPRYDYINGKQTPAGYNLNQTLEVKIRDLAKVGQILTGAIARGANQVSGVEYTVDDPDAFRAQARAQAFTKAQTKAKELTKLVGVRLGSVQTFSESVSGGPPIYFEKAYGMGGAGPVVPETQPGNQEITVTVNVVFEIR